MTSEATMARESKEVVLIYRLGSLGDTVVALPCFHLVARAFPGHKRVLLANCQMGTRDMPARAILNHTGLVNDYIEYPVGLRAPRELFRLRSVIAGLRPSLLVYLTEPRGLRKLYRDLIFFRMCGIRNVIGIPLRQEFSENQWLEEEHCFEPEARRLARCVAALGDAKLDDPTSWDLRLTTEERGRANQVLKELPSSRPVIACSVGAKAEVKDWGVANWQRLFSSLSSRYPGYALALLGAGRCMGRGRGRAAAMARAEHQFVRRTISAREWRRAGGCATLRRTRQRADAPGRLHGDALRRDLQRTKSAQGVVSIRRSAPGRIPRNVLWRMRA